jgi:hypothetical protein
MIETRWKLCTRATVATLGDKNVRKTSAGKENEERIDTSLRTNRGRVKTREEPGCARARKGSSEIAARKVQARSTKKRKERDSNPKTNSKREAHTIEINNKRLLEPAHLSMTAVREEQS